MTRIMLRRAFELRFSAYLRATRRFIATHPEIAIPFTPEYLRTQIRAGHIIGILGSVPPSDWPNQPLSFFGYFACDVSSTGEARLAAPIVDPTLDDGKSLDQALYRLLFDLEEEGAHKVIVQIDRDYTSVLDMLRGYEFVETAELVPQLHGTDKAGVEMTLVL